jgi:hypothetical protein
MTSRSRPFSYANYYSTNTPFPRLFLTGIVGLDAATEVGDSVLTSRKNAQIITKATHFLGLVAFLQYQSLVCGTCNIKKRLNITAL